MLDHGYEIEPVLPAPNGAGIHKKRQPCSRSQSSENLITEDSAALQFTALYHDRLRYCHDTGAWFVWDGSRWRKNTTGLAFHWARELARKLATDASDKVRAIAGRSGFANGVEICARRDPGFAVTAEVWDSASFLLGTPGGTVDLCTGLLRAADPAEGVTKLAAVTPTEHADCPLWLAFLDQATKGDGEMIRVLQQLAGYSLTGDTREQVLAFVHGSGGNGKGVFVNTLKNIMDDYAVAAAMETFVASTSNRHPTDLAMLRGARLVTASETEEDRAWAEARIKTLTGGDPITARFMRQDFFTYTPQFKLLIMGNSKPNLRNVDDAMRRRFIIIPFEHKPATVDHLLPQKLMAEWPGILRWMIDGCLDWQVNGLVRSGRDREATDDYFAEQDAFGQWLEDECDCEPGNDYKTATSAELFASWQAYALRVGEKPGSRKAFGSRLLKHGIERKRHEAARLYKGIRLRPPLHHSYPDA